MLEARLSSKNRCAAGKREFVQVLRLLETFPMATVHGAVQDALRLGAISSDAVRHLALARVEHRPVRLDTERYPQGRGAHRPNAGLRLHGADDGETLMTGAVEEAPQILLRHHLKKLKLPTVLREHEKLARQCATEG